MRGVVLSGGGLGVFGVLVFWCGRKDTSRFSRACLNFSVIDGKDPFLLDKENPNPLFQWFVGFQKLQDYKVNACNSIVYQIGANISCSKADILFIFGQKTKTKTNLYG